MKLTFNPSPNYRNEKTTTGIMTDLALCLLAVLFYAVIYYCAAFGPQYGLRVVLFKSVVTHMSFSFSVFYLIIGSFIFIVFCS